MIGHSEKTKSACAFVPYLSHGTVANLKIWLRGLATNIICSSGDLRIKPVARRRSALCHPCYSS